MKTIVSILLISAFCLSAIEARVGVTNNHWSSIVSFAAMDDQDENKPKHQKNIWIKGGVRTPQRLRWQPEMTVVAAIQTAGGFNWRPPEKVFILREGQRISILVRPIIKEIASDPKLQPGDIVEVPE